MVLHSQSDSFMRQWFRKVPFLTDKKDEANYADDFVTFFSILFLHFS